MVGIFIPSTTKVVPLPLTKQVEALSGWCEGALPKIKEPTVVGAKAHCRDEGTNDS